MKHRVALDSNYSSFWLNSGKTFRTAINPDLPITELVYPEFYDIKITDTCAGGCPYCYQKSTKNAEPYKDVTKKLRKFFSSLPKDKLPYQIAYGGGEPTSSPEFEDIIRMTKEEFDITPNFTTNGLWTTRSRDEQEKHCMFVKELCGGAAVSTHSHLRNYWLRAVDNYTNFSIRTNLHCIISDEKSVDVFLRIFEDLKDGIEYFVLLPYTNQGRAADRPKEVAWDYLCEVYPQEPTDKEKIAFGAMFFPYLQKNQLDVKLSLYEPDIFSKYIDCKDNGYFYASSFSDKVLHSGFLAL